ncbi:MAG: aminotransferase class I/II-fold pyridoxal phosphate-dependent enzyme [Bacteroidia bacterium]|nr:aminotransferase class I/II-fold pyridoxal phosphate-dependent enzyme [Bacteroidia bacterium]
MIRSVSNRIWLSPPDLQGDELAMVQQAILSNWIAPAGPELPAFEQEISQYVHSVGACALNSGTSAIHLGLIVLGVRTNDEVICPTFTYCATVNPILYQQATPIFVDSEPNSWNIDPYWLEIAIQDRIKKGKKPKAVIVVHLFGMPAQMKEILEICKQYDIPVLEDAAEAFGSSYQQIKLGTLGEIGVYSFNGNKIITTSGGGALVSQNQDYVDHARFLSTQAKDPLPYYHHSNLGYNYRLSNLLAALGRSQLKQIETKIQKKRFLFDQYYQSLSSIDGISFQEEPEHKFSSRWLTCLRLSPETGITPLMLKEALETVNVESRLLWKPLHQQTYYHHFPFYGSSVAETLFEEGISLPSGTSLLPEEQERVIQKIKEVLFGKVTQIISFS